MERIRIDKVNGKLKSGDYVIDSFDALTIETEVNSQVDILVSSLPDESFIKMIVSEESIVNLSILAERKASKANLEISVKKDGDLEGYFADFSKDVINLNCVINLEEEGATTNFRLASLGANKDLKDINISIKHLSPKTFGRVDNYGVCKDDARMVFSGTSHILKDSIKSKTQQNAKIMVFDKMSNAIAKPILRIDENDIEASHAAVVGKVSDEHIFYLTSRGLNVDEAKLLITLGYLKPILKGFSKETANEIDKLIEGRL